MVALASVASMALADGGNKLTGQSGSGNDKGRFRCFRLFIAQYVDYFNTLTSSITFNAWTVLRVR
jgi:hypothetical protein